MIVLWVGPRMLRWETEFDPFLCVYIIPPQIQKGISTGKAVERLRLIGDCVDDLSHNQRVQRGVILHVCIYVE
jgi:hypothetical protein